MAVLRSNLLTAIEEATGSEIELAFAPWRGKDTRSGPPKGLVVSSDDEVSRKLAESLGQCGVAPLFACTVVESRMVLTGREVLVVLCNERLADGTYEDVVNLAHRSHATIPLVVVSRTGDWPEYLRAVDRGAFDYVAYPPRSGDLERAIRSALVWQRQNCGIADAV